jgi:signal transduction histidine kinase
VAGLRHEPEGQSSLATAITHASRQLTETHDVRLNLLVRRDLPALPLDVEYNLLRIAQEAIMNAVKHAGAESIEVSLERAANDIQLTVQDDGNGFLESSGNGAALGHYGLIGMRERAAQIGADFNLETEPGRGTRICVIMPILQSEQIAR